MGDWKPLSQLLKELGIDNPVNQGSYHPQRIIQDIKSFDLRLLFPWHEFRGGQWRQDPRMLFFVGVGMLPIILVVVGMSITQIRLIYWTLGFYFSCLWALYFYSMFKTREVKPKTAVVCFFTTALVSVTVLLLLQAIPPWSVLYRMSSSEQFLSRLLGMIVGVGISEELCKAAIVFYIAGRPGRLLLPQTVVFYGMMSGLGFGIYEGVSYQVTVNREQAVDIGYFLNVLRLTSLPFLHAVWAGISAYFISFAMVVPKRRAGLRVVAILIPAVFHGLYNTFGGNLFGVIIAMLSVFFLVFYLSSCDELKMNLTKST